MTDLNHVPRSKSSKDEGMRLFREKLNFETVFPSSQKNSHCLSLELRANGKIYQADPIYVNPQHTKQAFELLRNRIEQAIDQDLNDSRDRAYKLLTLKSEE